MSVKPLNRSSVEASPNVAASTLTISNRQRAKKINLRLLKRIVAELLADLKIENADLEINLVRAAEMTLLNEKLLRHKGSTDVITFDYGLPVGRDSVEPKLFFKSGLERTLAPPKLHGELFICVDEAILQSKKFKTNWQSEIIRYIVHGILHLLGHDDLRAKAKLKMKREENRLLRQLSRRFNVNLVGRDSVEP